LIRKIDKGVTAVNVEDPDGLVGLPRS
jgi:hypothetical protein